MEKKGLKSTFIWKALLRIYGVYSSVLFILTFFIVFPFILMADVFRIPKLALIANHYWAHVFFFLIGVPMHIEGKEFLDKSKNYIFCPNHFSYLDIAILPFVPMPFKFIGKLSIAKVPFFGYMFRKFHITVDRGHLRNRYETYKRGVSALLEGFSLAIFPEGGIKSKTPPEMKPFKEGPFRMAIETGVQLVPVTMPDNWHIFPTDGKFYFRRRKCRMVIHEPIDPAKYTIDQLKEFQQDVFNLIQKELNRLNNLV